MTAIKGKLQDPEAEKMPKIQEKVFKAHGRVRPLGLGPISTGLNVRKINPSHEQHAQNLERRREEETQERKKLYEKFKLLERQLEDLIRNKGFILTPQIASEMEDLRRKLGNGVTESSVGQSQVRDA